MFVSSMKPIFRNPSFFGAATADIKDVSAGHTTPGMFSREHEPTMKLDEIYVGMVIFLLNILELHASGIFHCHVCWNQRVFIEIKKNGFDLCWCSFRPLEQVSWSTSLAIHQFGRVLTALPCPASSVVTNDSYWSMSIINDYCTCMYIYVCIYIYISWCIYIYIYTYIYMYI